MNFIRRAVSGTNNRYKDDKVELDLTYITPRIIAMGMPATGIEASFRNPAKEVFEFLESRHHGQYKVYNLSEKEYEQNICPAQVEYYPFPDHHAPSFGLMLKIVKSMYDWLHQNSNFKVVVHCKAGHGRTGTVISSFLLFNEEAQDCFQALLKFGRARSNTGSGVTHPSQCRSVVYAQYHLNYQRQNGNSIFDLIPPPKKVIRTIRIINLFRHKTGKFALILMDGEYDVLYNSAWFKPAETSDTVEMIYNPNFAISGDFTIKLFVDNTGPIKVNAKHKEVFRITLNTTFISGNHYELTQNIVEGPHKDTLNKTFDPTLRIIIDFDENESESLSIAPSPEDVENDVRKCVADASVKVPAAPVVP